MGRGRNEHGGTVQRDAGDQLISALRERGQDDDRGRAVGRQVIRSDPIEGVADPALKFADVFVAKVAMSDHADDERQSAS
jgi:hypothetical protein